MAVITGAQRAALPDSSFGYVEPGRAVNGKTPDKFRHFPIHDAAHVRNALARIAQGARFGAQAKAKVLAAAKKHGIQHDDGDNTGRALESLAPEVRFIHDRPEIRAYEEDGPRHISGYAAVFSKADGSPALSRRLGGFVERVMPGAFAEALRQIAADDVEYNVVCRYNHKDDMVLGTTRGGTLQLEVDERGLKYDVVPPNHRADVLELVDRGDVRYSSFAFCVEEPGEDDSWEEGPGNWPLRSLHKVSLKDVAPVMDPAYGDTSAVSRNISGAVESLATWLDADPTEVRSMLEVGAAKRFFKRSDKKLPKLDRESVADRSESRVLDDPAIALRRWSYADEPVSEEWTSPEDRQAPDDEELRAAMKQLSHEQLCQKWVQGEPCVRPDGHDGDHQPLCWARKGGMPCHHPMDHEGDHEPMTVKTRDADEGDEGTEQRDQADGAGISAVQALAKLAAKRKELTQLDD